MHLTFTFFSSFHSTREFLSHTICSPDDIETFLEQLRNETPAVTWQVRCFHYEGYTLPRLSHNALPKSEENAQTSSVVSTSSFPRLRRKVITSQATGSYQIKHCLDKTVAGVWKRAPLFTNDGAPFIKLVISKLLVLSNDKTRQDYMAQQSKFVSEGDEYAEFSTSIHVPGFQRRILAVRPEVKKNRMFKLSAFWISTLLLMTVPYRIWCSNQCDEVRVTVVKETFITPPRQADPNQRGWLSSLYSASNTTKTFAEDESFRDVMRQIRLYRLTNAMERLNKSRIAGQMEMPSDLTANTTSNATMLNATGSESSSNATKVDDTV
jgi:hypothetical protein